MNLGHRPEVIVALYQAGMLRSSYGPAEVLGSALKVLDPVGKYGQLNVIGPVGYRAKRQQIDLFRGKLRKKLISLLGGTLDSAVEVLDVSHFQ
jgi:hypothetical protein